MSLPLQAISTASLSQFNPLNTVSSNSLENILGDHEPHRSAAPRDESILNVQSLRSITPQKSSPSLTNSPQLHTLKPLRDSFEGQQSAEGQSQGIADIQEVSVRDPDGLKKQERSALDRVSASGSTAEPSARDAELPQAAERPGSSAVLENEASPLSTPAESPLLNTAERLLWAQIQNPNARLFKVSDLEQSGRQSTSERCPDESQVTDEKQEVTPQSSNESKDAGSPPGKNASYTSPR